MPIAEIAACNSVHTGRVRVAQAAKRLKPGIPRDRVRRNAACPAEERGGLAMIRTMGAAVGATIVLLFLASVAALLKWSAAV
jgi:hypothetical protein